MHEVFVCALGGGAQQGMLKMVEFFLSEGIEFLAMVLFLTEFL